MKNGSSPFVFSHRTVSHGVRVKSTRTEGGAGEGHLIEEGAGKAGREVLKTESVKKSVFKAPK